MKTTETQVALLRRLVGEVRADLVALAAISERMTTFLDGASDELEPVVLMGAAGWLHHYYTGVETCHERILRAFEGAPPAGPRHHRDVLEAVAAEVAGVRPAVVSLGTRDRLDALREFRHLYRHAYRIDLLWAEMRPRCEALAGLHTRLVQEIEQFLGAVLECAARIESG